MGKQDNFLYRMYIPLCGGVLLLAAVLRFAALGANPLSENEAVLALQALNLQTVTSGQILYLLPTALFFRLFGCSDLTARLLPALAGCILVLLPLLQARRWGYRRCLLLGLAFALDPSLLFWSKQADGLICVISLAFLVFILIGIRNRGWIIAAAALFCGGERFLPFLAALVLTVGLLFVLRKAFPKLAEYLLPDIAFPALRLSDGLIFVLALALFSTGFLAYPAGFGAVGSGWVNTFAADYAWADIGPAAFCFCVLIFLGLPLLLTLLSRGNLFSPAALVLFLFFALLLRQGVMVFPCAALGLWMIGSGFLGEWLAVFSGWRNAGFLFSACLLPALVFFLKFRVGEVLNSAGLNSPLSLKIGGVIRSYNIPQGIGYAVILFVGVCILLLIVKILETYTEKEFVRAGLWAGCAVLCLFGLISGAWRAGGFSREGDSPSLTGSNSQIIPLGGNRAFLSDGPLQTILPEISRKDNGSEAHAPALNRLPSEPLLRWILRDQTKMTFSEAEHVGDARYAFIIDGPNASYGKYGYIGASYEWSEHITWNGTGLAAYARWLWYDEVPAAKQVLSVWQQSSMVLNTAGTQSEDFTIDKEE